MRRGYESLCAEYVSPRDDLDGEREEDDTLGFESEELCLLCAAASDLSQLQKS
jgi:hypothetical protein